MDNGGIQADITRIEGLKRLAASGLIDEQSRYFNHLIDVYGDLSHAKGKSRTFTDRERERVDLYLQSFSA